MLKTVKNQYFMKLKHSLEVQKQGKSRHRSNDKEFKNKNKNYQLKE